MENMDTIKSRNDMDLTEAEYIKKRWQEYTEKLWKKDLHNPDNHSGVGVQASQIAFGFPPLLSPLFCFKS